MSDLVRVSTVLRLLFPHGLDHVDQADLDRGTRLHSYMELYVNNLLHGYEYVPPAEIQPVVKWINDNHIQFVSAEERINHHYGYTGQPDLDCYWNGEKWFFDWKFSQVISTQNRMQLTAYHHFDKRKVAFVQCNKDGVVKVIKCKPDHSLWAAFLSGLNVIKFHQSQQPFQLTPEQIETIKRDTLEILCQTEN